MERHMESCDVTEEGQSSDRRGEVSTNSTISKK